MINFFSIYNVEIITIIFSFLYVFFVVRKSKFLKTTWVLAFVYAICFEFINSYYTGSYEYNIYLFGLFGIPLYVPMMWANLLTWVISKKKYFNGIPIGKSELIKSLFFAFFGSLFISSFDIVIDIIAVQKDLRTWHFDITEGWFGVNYGNFLGWFVVAFLFIFGVLISKDLKLKIWEQAKYFILCIIIPLVIQTIIFVFPFVFDVCPPQNQEFTYLFLIPVVIIFGGGFLFLKNTKRSLFGKYDIATEIFFVIVHWYAVEYFIFQYFNVLLLVIALCFAILHTGFLVYNLFPRWTKK